MKYYAIKEDDTVLDIGHWEDPNEVRWPDFDCLTIRDENEAAALRDNLIKALDNQPRPAI